MTLSRLLLIFPACFLGIYCAALWDSSKRISYRYFAAINDVRQAYLQLASIEERFGPHAVQMPLVDQWLDNSLPANHPAWRLFVERVPADPWGNPYRCALIPMLNGERFGEFGVYSTGRDGVSLSKGNDSDDLNSWDQQTGSYYRAEISSENRKQYAINGLILTPFVYAALLALGYVIKRLFRNGRALPQFDDKA